MRFFSKHLRATVRKLPLCFFSPNFLFLFPWKIQTQIQSNNCFKEYEIFAEFLEILRCRRENKRFSEELVCWNYSEFFRVVFSLDFVVFFVFEKYKFQFTQKILQLFGIFLLFLKIIYSKSQDLLKVHEILWDFLQALRNNWKNERLLKNTPVLQLFEIFLRLFVSNSLVLIFVKNKNSNSLKKILESTCKFFRIFTGFETDKKMRDFSEKLMC